MRLRLGRGFTLVECMVGLGLSLLLTLAALAGLSGASLSWSRLDAEAQLQVQARLARQELARLAQSAGFMDLPHAATVRAPSLPALVAADIGGFHNASLDPAHPLGPGLPHRPGDLADGSDILILRFQAAESLPGSGQVDPGPWDCQGYIASAPPQDRDERIVNILHVARSNDDEPNLMCSTLDAAGRIKSTQPLISGVEFFQLRYGLAALTGPPDDPEAGSGPPLRDVRADQLLVPGDEAATQALWRRVQSLRIGLVLRSATASLAMDAQGPAAGAPGTSQVKTGLGPLDLPAGTVWSPPADGRWRQPLVLTVQLRNALQQR